MEAPPSVFAIFGGRLLFGQERANIEVLKSLRGAGCQVNILLRNDNYPEVEEFHKIFVDAGFSVSKVPFADPLIFRHEKSAPFKAIIAPLITSFLLAKMIRDAKSPVIYLFNSYYSLTILPYLLFSKTPVLYRAGDVPPTHNQFWRILWACVRRRIARVVAVSEFIKGELVSLGVPVEAISVIYSRPRDPCSVNNAAPPYDSSVPTIVYVGQLTEEKGLRELREAFEILSEDIECRLVAIGRIDPDWPGDAFARNIRDKLDAAGYGDRVVFPGFVEDVYAYLSSARVHVQPSIWDEPLANSVMEAKRAGVPSVIFASGGLPEVIQDHVDGTVCTTKSGFALAEAMRPYLVDANLAAERGKAARESLSRLGKDRFEEKWLSVLSQAAGKPKLPNL